MRLSSYMTSRITPMVHTAVKGDHGRVSESWTNGAVVRGHVGAVTERMAFRAGKPLTGSEQSLRVDAADWTHTVSRVRIDGVEYDVIARLGGRETCVLLIHRVE